MLPQGKYPQQQIVLKPNACNGGGWRLRWSGGGFARRAGFLSQPGIGSLLWTPAHYGPAWHRL